MKGKRPVLLLAAVALALALIVLLSARQTKPAKTGVELLQNGEFELVSAELLPEHWLPESYFNDPDITDFSVTAGKSGNGIRIDNHSPNDARFAQPVQVSPDTLYRFSGYVRALADGGRGANLSVGGIYVFSEPVYDTKGEWEGITLYGRTGSNQREVALFARLGGYSGESAGFAEFDGLSLMAVEDVPNGYYVESWDQQERAQIDISDTDTAPARPAAPWLLVMMAFGALLLLFFASGVERHAQNELSQSSRQQYLELFSLLLAAFLSRLLIAWFVPGFPVDISCFRAWANQMAEIGPAGFYLTDTLSDYPPGYMLVLWPLGLIGRALGTGATEMMVKLPAMFFDMGIVTLLYLIAKKSVGHRAALLLAMLYAFSPLPYLVGSAWGQVDSVPSLLLMIAVLMISTQRWQFALPVYVLAVLMKPQALMAGPLGLLALVMEWFWQKDRKALLRSVLIGILLSILAAAAVALPFFNEQNGIPWLISHYGDTMGYYNYASVNAANLFFLFGRNWTGIADPAPFLLRLTGLFVLLIPTAVFLWQGRKSSGEEKLAKSLLNEAPLLAALIPALVTLFPMSFSLQGTLLMVSSFLMVSWQYVRGKKAENLSLMAGVLLTLFFVLGVMMHERYLFLAVSLLTLAYVLRRDRRLLLLLICVTALCFLNSGVALDRGVRIGGASGNLSAPMAGLVSDSAWLEYALSAFSLPVASYALYLGMELTRPDSQVRPFRRKLIKRVETRRNDRLAFLADTPRVANPGRKDVAIILGITALYAILAFVNLGSTVSPQTPWVSGGENVSATLDLGETRSFRFLMFPGIHWQDSEFTVETSENGEDWFLYPARVQYGDCFAWRTLSQASRSPDGSVSYFGIPQELSGRYIRLTAPGTKLTLMEVVAQDLGTGENIPLSPASPGAEALVDEQGTLSGPPSWYNSMYFDEIYHARTAYEQRNALLGEEPSAIYETSHPPLGKVLMTFSVMVFGMTPFGWRFAGALAGVLMLPGLYLLGRQLTGRKRFGVFAMLLMAFDFMHFTQTRIATIDSFATLFIIYAYYFMFRWMNMDYFLQPLKKTLPSLFLSGLMMGLAIASKWTGIYAGAGLAVLFFWSVVRMARRGLACAKLTRKELDALGNKAEKAKAYAEKWFINTLLTALWCLLFFVAVPAVIYYLSYFPVFISTPGGLTVRKVISANQGMFSYHSAKGLGADHFFSSPWYEWPLIIKPMYYYSGGVVNGTASTILSFGNPLVWWGGLIALVMVLILAGYKAVSYAGIIRAPESLCRDRRPMMLLTAFAAQYLPWILVPRGTYIYHYFPSVPFIILCITLLVSYLMKRYGRVGKALLIGLPTVALILFIAFFPYLSGMRVSTAWLDAMKWFPNWLYY